MQALELIRWSMQMSQRLTDSTLEDLREHALIRATAGSKGGDGNHALWTIGHLCVVEGDMPHVLLGEPNPVEHLRSLFGMGTECRGDGAGYPPFDELFRTYRDLRAKNLRLLESIGTAGLDRAPKRVPPGFEKEMQTTGQTLLLIAMHNLMHLGQLMDMRRAAGFKRRF